LFAFRLSKELGILDAEASMRRSSSAQPPRGWKAYELLEPFGFPVHERGT